MNDKVDIDVFLWLKKKNLFGNRVKYVSAEKIIGVDPLILGDDEWDMNQ